MPVTVYRVNKSCMMRNSLLDFVRFNNLHTGEASCHVLLEIIREWGLERITHSITTKNATNMIKGAKLLCKELPASTCLDQYKAAGKLQARCMAYV